MEMSGHPHATVKSPRYPLDRRLGGPQKYVPSPTGTELRHLGQSPRYPVDRSLDGPQKYVPSPTGTELD
jgi:hypothetical protein